MAASVNSTATTLEGQLWETALHIQLAELAIPVETRPNNIQVNVDTENQIVSITFSVAATFAVDSGGSLVASPTTYLP